MKKILVPTDFTEYSGYASEMAMFMAESMGAEAHFYHRVYRHPLWHKLTEEQRRNSDDSNIWIKLAEENFRQLRWQYRDSSVTMNTSYSYGDLLLNIADYVKKENIALMVMGSHGIGGFKEFLVGSNAQKALHQSDCPVLVVKRPVIRKGFRNVIFVSDFSKRAIEPFRRLVEFCRPFNSHIHLLSLETPTGFLPNTYTISGDIQAFKDYSEELNCTAHLQDGKSVEEGIKEFAGYISADLIVTPIYPKPPLLRFFTRNIAIGLVNHLELPVMTILSKKG